MAIKHDRIEPEIAASLNYVHMVRQIEEYKELIKKAVLCCRQRVEHPEFARLEMTSMGHFRLGWPETAGDGYYESSYIAAQSEVIEPTLFVKKTVAEIEAEIVEEERKHEEALEKKRQRYRALQWELDKNNEAAERTLLAKLKKKYGEA